ncbi:bifunctional diguanylate cyclase/phosphodiesterase [Shewanella cyperi]|uniref:bifunctional diguanylate cyclase/phosphodiesterase n=1 Tax=Shewanella cyperi TaxID=2814292 RepID=UPI001A94068B|nr:EAL domain-containing protein [Shewanella cyperi]QSX39445.1 EAL domain-containing protein [Shewanella cyperi]
MPAKLTLENVSIAMTTVIIHQTHRESLFKVAAMVMALVILQIIVGSISIPDQLNHVKHYLLVHSFMEMASVVICMMVFIIGWNAQTHQLPTGFAVLSIIFLCVGLFDSFHIFAYVGMPDFFTQNDVQKHLNFWMSARFLAAFGLLWVVLSLSSRKSSKINKYALLLPFLIFTFSILWVTVNHQDWMPNWFIPGQGLTSLKKNLEYIFILTHFITAAVLFLQLKKPQTWSSPMLMGAVIVMALSELYFTWYTTMTGTYNVLGHFYKVIAYFMIYRAIVVESLENPYRKLEQSQQTLDLAITASNTGLWRWEINGGYSYMSPVLKAQLGYQDQELPSTYPALSALMHPEDSERFLRHLKHHILNNSDDVYEDEFRLKHKKGNYRWIYSRGKIVFNKKGEAIELIGTHTDITERKFKEEKFKSALQAAPNAMLMIDIHGNIVLTNSRANELFGYPENALIGTPITKLMPESSAKHHQAHVEAYMSAPEERQMGEGRFLFAKRKNGQEFRIEVGLTPIETEDGKYVLASLVDITERIESQRKIEQLTNYDALTELPNRELLKVKGEFIINQAGQMRHKVGMIYIGLDRFKYLNDSFGHLAGDAVLIELVARIKPLIKPTDIFARIVGDEFAIIMTNVSEEDMARLSVRIMDAVAKPCNIQSDSVTITASIGIAVYPEDSKDYISLLQHADTAMEKVKEIGRNSYLFFSKDMQIRTSRALKIDSALREALQKQQLYLHYQPQVNIEHQKLIGVEALLRWEHPELGMISPAEFIPQAEANGLIIPIGEWVLKTALNQLRQWIDDGYEPIVMAINLSTAQFRHENLNNMVSQVLHEVQLPPEYLELELTESMAMTDPEKVIGVLDKLHAQGVRIAIDDFGTGYSSLSYLKKFNIDKLKIDQSFVRDIATDAGDRAIVTTIIQMATILGFNTIAEGVETSSQLDFLRENGCHEYQGYKFSKPIPPDTLAEKYLQKNSG